MEEQVEASVVSAGTAHTGTGGCPTVFRLHREEWDGSAQGWLVKELSEFLCVRRFVHLPTSSLLGKCPRVLMILQCHPCTLSIAFVVWITLRTARGNAKSGISRPYARRVDRSTCRSLRLVSTGGIAQVMGQAKHFITRSISALLNAMDRPLTAVAVIGPVTN